MPALAHQQCQTPQSSESTAQWRTQPSRTSRTGLVTSGTAEQLALPSTVRDVVRSPGQPLDRTTRAFMESRFGHDFSRVRVHTDAKAAESSKALNALAYTVGEHVVFAPNRYDHATHAGRRLLAHELAHVVQQGGGAVALQRQ